MRSRNETARVIPPRKDVESHISHGATCMFLVLFLHAYVSTEGKRWLRGEKGRHLPNRIILFVVLLKLASWSLGRSESRPRSAQ